MPFQDNSDLQSKVTPPVHKCCFLFVFVFGPDEYASMPLGLKMYVMSITASIYVGEQLSQKIATMLIHIPIYITLQCPNANIQ